LASVKFENLDDTLLQVVQKMQGDVETKDLIYKGLKAEVTNRQKTTIAKYLETPSTKKGSTQPVAGIKKLNRTNEVVNDVMKLPKDKRLDKIKEITSMLSPEDRDVVTEAILSEVNTRTTKKQILSAEKRLDAIVKKYEDPTVRTPSEKALDNLSVLERRSELVKDLAKKSPSEAISDVNNLVTVKEFGRDAPRLKDLILEQADVTRRSNEMKETVRTARAENQRAIRAEERRAKEIQGILDKYTSGEEVAPKPRPKAMDEVSQVKRRKEMLNKLSKETDDIALDRINSLVKEEDFGAGYLELRQAMFDQSRELRSERLNKQANKILEGRKPKKNKTVTDKILDLKDFTELGDDIFTELSKKKLGLEMSIEDFKRLADASTEIQQYINQITGLPLPNPDHPFRKHPEFLRIQQEIGTIRANILPPKTGVVATSLQKGAMLFRVGTQVFNLGVNTVTTLGESIKRNFVTFTDDITPEGVLRSGNQFDSVKKPHQLKYKFQFGDGVPPSKRAEFIKIASENAQDFWNYSYDGARNSSLIDNQIVLGEKFYTPRNAFERTYMASIHAMGAVDQFYASMGKLEASYSYAKRLVN
jgi:hypothetical protein